MERSSVERMLRESMEARLVLRILYRSGAGEATERDIEVRDIQGGCCRAWCHLRHEMRTFRVDRIEEARMLADAFMPDSEANSVRRSWFADPDGVDDAKQGR
jgi:predicted DNA-binding transcriptional regulator YafY